MVFGVVTHNAIIMKKASQLIEEKYPKIICYGCAAHGLNLIFCNMIKLKTCKNIIKRAKGVKIEFRHKHMLVDILKDMQKAENVNCTLKLPVKTRWAFMVTSLESVKKNKVVLHKIAVSKEPEKKAATCQKKFSALFWTTHFGMKAKPLQAYQNHCSLQSFNWKKTLQTWQISADYFLTSNMKT